LFNQTQIKLSNRITINFLNIENYTDELIALIKEEIVKIWDGDLSDDDLKFVKKQMQSFFKDKQKDEEKKLAFVAEFICHLYLRHQGFSHYSVLKNLEEIKAPKKGFDGLYELDNSMWLVESKCAMPTTETNHNNKVGEAYRDIKNKIEKTSIIDNENNPWENAKNHFLHTEKKNDALLKDIKKLKNLFIEGKKIQVQKFNVIPCSTIYLGDKWSVIDSDLLKTKLEGLLKRYHAKNINVLCINKKSADDFLKFINE
jgi:hypothetical protein